jgi:DNA-binding YbaB/EbfC family protein
MSDENIPTGLPDLGGLLGKAQQMMAASAEAAEQVVEGVAGGGAVRIEVNGRFEFQSVSIAPEAVDPSDVTMLEDLVLAALNDAAAKITENQQQVLGDMPDLGGLSGLLGG